jgi:23S rRNA (uridine2552-2'-O)-methyltransferase
MPSRREVLGDFYYRKAKREGFRSRSALKLKEIADSCNLIRPGAVVVDLGAAPGGWLQVERELVGADGLVIGVDLESIKPLPYDNVKLIKGDINDQTVLKEILGLAGHSADVIVSDLAPKFSGIHDLDHSRQIGLAMIALKIAPSILRRGGSMVIKVLMGSEFLVFRKELQVSFNNVRVYKPKASRETSTETYIICRGFLGRRFGDDPGTASA